MKRKNSLSRSSKQINRNVQNINSSGKTMNRKVQLPKLNHSQFNQKIAKKTLMNAIKNIEQYIELCSQQVSNQLTQCLDILRKECKREVRNLYSQYRFTQSRQNSSFFKENCLVQSQVVNVNRCQLKKVASKDLFDKVSMMKKAGGQLLHVTDTQVISALKSKIQEKENTIRKLHTHIDQLKLQSSEIKDNLALMTTQNKSLKQEKEQSDTKSAKIYQKNEDICFKLIKLQTQIENATKTQKCLVQKNELLKKALIQRESEITSIYQICQNKFN